MSKFPEASEDVVSQIEDQIMYLPKVEYPYNLKVLLWVLQESENLTKPVRVFFTNTHKCLDDLGRQVTAVVNNNSDLLTGLIGGLGVDLYFYASYKNGGYNVWLAPNDDDIMCAMEPIDLNFSEVDTMVLVEPAECPE
ncbi:hypothetical protein KKA15_05255 [Patescibacteria group bacterium]|nr:hypothetical protein [Patescibacteria group bacterium]